MFTVDSKVFAAAIDRYCKQNGILKIDFHRDSGISSASMTQWRQESYIVSAKSIKRLEEYTGIRAEDFIARYGEEKPESTQGEIDDLREEVRRRPEVAFMLRTSKGVPASVILEISAKLQKWKEENGID